MTLGMAPEIRTPHEVQHASWRITRETDPTRRKEVPRGMDLSYYWLVRGVNAQRLYDTDRRSGFAFDIADVSEQREYAQRLEGSVNVHRETFQILPQETTDNDEQVTTVVGSYQHAKFGRAAIIVRQTHESHHIEHTWIPLSSPQENTVQARETVIVSKRRSV